jgi:hypothetical protein
MMKCCAPIKIQNSLFPVRYSPVRYYFVQLAVSFIFAAQTGLWCNGSTTDSDSVCLGSKPSNPTKAGYKDNLSFIRPFHVKTTVIGPPNQLKILLAEKY